jgi:hypothetical protein
MALVTGCYTTVKIAPMPPEKYEVIGRTTGSACGFLLFGDYVGAFIPIMMSSRVERAREEALGKVPDATDLINVSVNEFWFYGAIIQGRCVKVSGEAIKS